MLKFITRLKSIFKFLSILVQIIDAIIKTLDDENNKKSGQLPLI